MHVHTRAGVEYVSERYHEISSYRLWFGQFSFKYGYVYVRMCAMYDANVPYACDKIKRMHPNF